jgi:hypothetical protein
MTTGFAAATLAFAALWLACLAYLHVAPTGYSPLRNAVSEYGVGRYAWGYRAQVTFAALSAICLAVALPGHPSKEVVLLCVFAGARIAIAAFPTDLLDGGRWTTTGMIHLRLAAIAFGSICWCASALPRHAGGRPVLGWIASLGALGTFAGLRLQAVRPVLGLLERLFYAAVIAWFFLVAARLLS